MPWTLPRTWVTNEIPTAALFNTHIRDNESYLKSAVSAQIIITAAGMWPTITEGCAALTQIETAANKQNLKVLDFDAATVEYAQCTIPAMPSDWDGGTLTAQFIWMADDLTTNSVVWAVKMRSFADNEAIDAVWGAANTVADANGGASYTVRISAATSAITAAGTPAGGELLQIEIYRYATDAADTLTVDARLLGVIFTYTRN